MKWWQRSTNKTSMKSLTEEIYKSTLHIMAMYFMRGARIWRRASAANAVALYKSVKSRNALSWK